MAAGEEIEKLVELICRMVMGRKTMRVDRSDPIEFIKDETIIFPPDYRVDVVFPGRGSRPADRMSLHRDRARAAR